MPRNNTWSNSDGLVVGFGTHTEDNGVLAVTGDSGTIKTYTVELPDAALLEDTDAFAGTSLPVQNVTIPRGSYIQSAVFVVTTGFATGTSIDFGTYDATGGTVDVADGIDVDVLTAALNEIGDTVTCNGSLVGGVLPVGKVSNTDCVVAFAYQGTAYTAGAGVLTLTVVVPHGSQGTSLAA